MQFPGYLLNPGDMFSVDPERVLFATGARKFRKTSPETLQGVAKGDETDLVVDDDAEDLLEDADEAVAEAAEAVQADSKSEDADAAAATPSAKPSEDPKKTLLTLVKNAKTIMSDNKTTLSAKRKQELRAFSQSAKKALSQIRGTRIDANTPLEETIDALEETLRGISLKVPGQSSTKTEPEAAETLATETAEAIPATSSNPQSEAQSGKEDAYLARKNAELLHAALQRAQANPIDVRKPYATPWKPREFMSAFAFIPRYLEVNQSICSAVYLRHPVARPGLAEVPTPFHGETMGLAFNWYLRRR